MFEFITKFFSFTKSNGRGLLKLSKDDRDFDLGELVGWFDDYTPKNNEVNLATITWRNQRDNTCSFNSKTCSKEIDEGVKLSVRSLVCMGVKLGMIKGNGFADLRTAEYICQKFGIADASVLPEGDPSLSWSEYSNPALLTPDVLANMALRKDSTFWKVTSINQILKLLDDGRTVRIGIDWRAAFNMSGGFSFPWLLNFLISWVVGGHAIFIKGYRQNYNGASVALRFRNSYGAGYGDNGDGYIKPEDLQKFVNEYGAYASLDMPKDVAKWILSTKGKIVRDSWNADDARKVDLYLMDGGKKRPFKSMSAVYAYGFLDEDIIDDEAGYLKDIPLGPVMDFWQAPPDNIKLIKAFLLRRDALQIIFKDEINDLTK